MFEIIHLIYSTEVLTILCNFSDISFIQCSFNSQQVNRQTGEEKRNKTESNPIQSNIPFSNIRIMLRLYHNHQLFGRTNGIRSNPMSSLLVLLVLVLLLLVSLLATTTHGFVISTLTTTTTKWNITRQRQRQGQRQQIHRMMKRQTVIYDGAEFISIASFLKSQCATSFTESSSSSLSSWMLPSDRLGCMTFVTCTNPQNEKVRWLGIPIDKQSEQEQEQEQIPSDAIEVQDGTYLHADSVVEIPNGIKDSDAISTAAAALCGVHCGGMVMNEEWTCLPKVCFSFVSFRLVSFRSVPFRSDQIRSDQIRSDQINPFQSISWIFSFYNSQLQYLH